MRAGFSWKGDRTRGVEITTLVELSLAAGPSAASKARESLSALSGKLPQERLDDVRLLVSELVTNSVRHAAGTTDGAGMISFTVSMHPGSLRVEVRDSGKGFEKTVTPSTPDQVSGWGLQIVERLSDRWGVDPATSLGSTVWFEIDL